MKEEISLMKKYAHLIWGGIPIDTEWAINTQVWKTFKEKNKLL